MFKSLITDPSSGNSAKVDHTKGEDKALVVATRQLKTPEAESLFFLNEIYGVGMNIDASPGGTPEQIHNGIDTVLWTGSNIVGVKVTFDSTAQAYQGTHSVFIDNPSVNDVFEFDNGSPLVVTDSFISATMWIYVQSDWGIGDSIGIYGWDSVLGMQVGATVLIEDYFNISDFGSWQKVTIPIVDFEPTGQQFDGMRVQVLSRSGAKSPVFYMDVIQLEETGTPISFDVHPLNGTWLHINTISQIFVDAYDATLADSTMPNLSYNKILGVTLAAGYNFQYIKRKSDIVFSINIKSLADLMQLPNVEMKSLSFDGTNTMMAIKNDISKEPIILKAEDNDFLRFTVSEDLTGFLMFRSALTGYSEVRKQNGST